MYVFELALLVCELQRIKNDNNNMMKNSYVQDMSEG